MSSRVQGGRGQLRVKVLLVDSSFASSEPGSPAFLEMGASTLNLSNEQNYCMKPFKNGFNVTSEKE